MKYCRLYGFRVVELTNAVKLWSKEFNVNRHIRLLATTSELVEPRYSFFSFLSQSSIRIYCVAMAHSTTQHSSYSVSPLLAVSLFASHFSVLGSRHTHHKGTRQSYGVIKDWPDFSHARECLYCIYELLRRAATPPTPTLVYSILLLLVYILSAIVISFSYGLLVCMSMAATDEASSSSLYIQEIIQYS